MNRAELLTPTPSARQGAFQAVIVSVSPAPSRTQSAGGAKHSGPFGHQSQRHSRSLPPRTVAGCALVASLSFGLALSTTAAQAQAAPSFRFLAPAANAPKTAAKPKTAAQIKAGDATSTARRAAFASAPRLHLMPRTAQISAPRVATAPRAAKSQVTAAPQFPGAFSALRIAQSFGREMARINAKNSAAKVPGALRLTVAPRKPAAIKPFLLTKASAPQFATTSVGGGKMIRLTSAVPLDAPLFPRTRPAFKAISSPLSPAALYSTPLVLTPLAPAKIQALRPNLGGMKKVIDASSLVLPPLSQPLPQWMQSASVKIDRFGKMPKRLAPRFAQNPGAAPVRNPAAPVTNSDRLANQIEVAVSTFVVLLTTTDLQTVAVADPNIADVAVVNSRSVLLNGKTAGVTSLVIVDGQKIRQYTVRVTASPGSRAVDIAGAIGIPGVSVRPLKDALVLEGEVANAEEGRRAVEIAGIYAPKVINQLAIRGQISQEAGTAASLRDLINLPGISVRVSGDTAILTGTVDTPQQIQDADIIARTGAKNVINLLRLPALTVDQVRESLGAGTGEPLNTGEVPGASAPIGSSIAGPNGANAFNVPGTYSAPAPLTLRQSGGSLLLEGSVGSQAQLDQILAQAARTGLPILNRIQAPTALTTDQGVLTSIAQAIGRPGVRVSGSAKRLVLEGVVSNTEEAVAVEQIARAFAAQVDNLLQTPNPRLIDVDVSIVEITRTGLKNLGFTFPSLLDASNSGFVLGQRSVRLDLPGPLLSPGADTGNSFRGALTQQTAFQAALRAEITNQNVRLLSNPRTTVLSGRTATFQVGGQVPVPVSITQSATGTTTGISFKDFGVLVDVVPNASANGAVTMRVKTEISQPDPSIGFTPFAGASIIPGFQRRAATTEVTTSPGGTIALGGLISTTTRTLITKIPLLGNLPILGSLFTSKRFQNDQSELVIFVTPRLLPNPLPAGTTVAAGVVAVGNTVNVGTTLGNPGLATGGISGSFGAGSTP